MMIFRGGVSERPLTFCKGGGEGVEPPLIIVLFKSLPKSNTIYIIIVSSKESKEDNIFNIIFICLDVLLVNIFNTICDVLKTIYFYIIAIIETSTFNISYQTNINIHTPMHIQTTNLNIHACTYK